MALQCDSYLLKCSAVHTMVQCNQITLMDEDRGSAKQEDRIRAQAAFGLLHMTGVLITGFNSQTGFKMHKAG